jgi:hypothetical protein
LLVATLFADRVRVATATTGTGTVNLGAAQTGYRTFAQAVADGALTSGCTVYYAIQDGFNWECGSGVYTAGAPDTMTRVVNSSSSGGTTAISLSGSAIVGLTLTQASVVTATITGGTIDGATVGAASPSTGAFTTLTSSTPSAGTNSTVVATTAFVRSVASTAGVSIQWTGGVIVTNSTYYFTISAPYAGTITSMDSYSGTGSFTANVQLIATITGTATSVTGLSAVSVTSTQTNTSATAANTFSATNVIQVIITSATSSPTNAVLNLRITKT